ncbi:Spermidine hydroxycinnamoyl transferase [Linum grandiflorum]
MGNSNDHKLKMKVTIKNSYMVKPAESTWTGRQALTEWDQIGAITHVPTVYFYKPSAQWLTPSSAVLTTLIHSLSLALVPFYPLAGRVYRTSGGRMELECNAMGVRFVVAESDWRLEDFGDDFSPSPNFESLVPEVDYELPIHDWPLLLLQLTKYQCGGISLTFNICHAVVDGLSALHFFSEWTRIARGESVKTMPFLDRTVLRAGMPPRRQPKFSHTEFNRPPGLLPDLLNNQKIRQEDDKSRRNEVVKTFKLAKTKVAMLKDMANNNMVKLVNGEDEQQQQRPYTTYETLTAHIWKCTCKARDLSPEQPTTLGVCVDSRSRMQPALPKGYFGNAILDVQAIALAGELTSRPLGYAAKKIREAIEKVDAEFLDSAIDFLKSQPDLRKYQDFGSTPFFGYPNLGVISWLRLPLFGMDFGWGKEIYMGPATHDFDGDSMILASQNGDGSVLVAICLREDHMESFKKCFYEDMM